MNTQNGDTPTRKITIKQILTILVTLITLTFNGLANALPLNGVTTGEISDLFESLFVPAAYVFSIWGLIYLGLIAYTVYQALPAQRDDALLNRIAPYYWVASIANSAWIVLWHYAFYEWTLVAMVTLLISLILAYLEISKARSGFSRLRWWLVQAPFSLYLGWISVATIANFGQILWGSGFAFEIGPLAERNLTVVMIFIAVILGLTMLWREKDYIYTGVLVWAFIGIALKQAAFVAVANTAWSAAGILALGMIVYPFIDRAGNK